MERPIHPLWAIVLLLPILISTLGLFAGLGLLFWLSLHQVPNIHSTEFATFLELEYSGLDNYIALARTYLQRQAMLNTGLVTVIAWLLGLPLAILVANLLIQGRRTPLAVIALVPIMMPTVLGALGWRKLFDLLYPIYNSDYSILALALIQTWRVLPIMAGILLLGAVQEQNIPQRVTRFSYPAVGLSLLISAFLIITDVSVGLIFTEGESLNQATPLWGTWAFQLGYTAGNLGQSMASLISFMPLLVVLVLPLPMLANRIQWCHLFALQSHETTNWQRLRMISMGLFFTIPLMMLFFQPANLEISRDLFSQLHYLFVKSSYGQWFMNTTFVWCGASLVAMLLGLPAGYSLARQWGPLANLLLWIGLIAGPVAFIPLAWSNQHWAWSHSRWILAWFYGACTAPISVWLTVQIAKRIANQVTDVAQSQFMVERGLIWLSVYFTLIISFVVTVQGFSAALVLGGPTLNVGIVTQLAYNTTLSPTVLALAVCLPTLLGIFICGLILRLLFSMMATSLDS